MMGLRNLSPRIRHDGTIIPFTKFGVQILSIGFFIEEKRGVIWRGPMLHQMLEKMLFQVHFPKLDYFLVDLPPGTGDTLLSLSQLISVNGAIVVSTPQEVALADAIKAIHAFDQLQIPLLGMVENMAGHPFGSGKVKEWAEKISVPFLASLPLEEKVCQSGDEGVPFAFHSSFFSSLAHNVTAQLK